MNFKEMLYSQNIGEITRGDLKKLSLKQLEVYARLLGVPYSGERNKRADRLFEALTVRHFLAQSDDPQFYATRYSVRTLKDHIKRTGGFVPPNRYAMAVGLLNWRNKCRREGAKFYKEVKEELAKQPKQIKLF